MAQFIKSRFKKGNTAYEFLFVSILFNACLIFLLPNIGKVSYLHFLYFLMTFVLSNATWLLLNKFVIRKRPVITFLISHTSIIFFFVVNAYHYTIFNEHLGFNQLWLAISGIFTGEAKISFANYLAYIQQSSVVAAAIWLILAFCVLFPFRLSHNHHPASLNLKFSLLFSCILGVFIVFKPGIADESLKTVQNAIPYVSFAEFREPYPNKQFGLDKISGTRDLEAQQIEKLIEYRRQLGEKNITFEKEPNILFMHLESLRHDMLAPEIMPNLHDWGHTKANVLANHYTTSSNTTAGMFGLLHGLAGSYFQTAPLGEYQPIPLDILQISGYTVNTYHGKSLAYDSMYERFFEATQDADYYGHFGWDDSVNDKKVLEKLYEDIKLAQENNEKRFDYVKLDSTHWNYAYPDAFEKFTPVIEPDFAISSLLNLHMKSFSQELLNRYKNASHYTDHIVFEFLKKLDTIGYLDNTIVVITGDHGEEFWEHGRFGHIYGLSQEQIRVISIVHFPEKVSINYKMTSHQDIFPTLFSYMGININIQELFTGKNLLEHDTSKEFSLSSLGTISNMQRYTEAVMDEEIKVEYSLNERLEIHSITDHDDEKLDQYSKERVRKLILKAIKMKSSFLQNQN